MGALPGTAPTGPALKAASIAGGPEVSTAAKAAQSQRKQIDAIKSRRKAQGKPPGQTKAKAEAAGAPQGDPSIQGQPATPPTPSPAPASPGAGGRVPAPPAVVQAAAATGSGFLLGVFAWALGLAYLRGGSSEVKGFLSAKFLNRPASTSAAGYTRPPDMPVPAASPYPSSLGGPGATRVYAN